MRYLVFDISNMLHRSFYAQRQESDDTIAGLATHVALTMLNKYYKQFKPDQLIMAFDRSSWRKEYTASEKCVSKKPYKGNRRQDMSPAQQAKYKRFLGHLHEFECLMRDHTTVFTLMEDKLEADDLIAGFVQIYSDEDNEIIIISSDSDLHQLKKYPNVKIVSPADGKEAELEEFDNNPDFYLFTKCVRGDPTDNIQSAYPKVHAPKIRKAYDDPFERIQFMKNTWKNFDGREMLVEEVFKENQLLIDLTKQPVEIRAKILDAVDKEMSRDKEFSLFFFMKYIGKFELNKIKENIDQYLPMLSKR